MNCGPRPTSNACVRRKVATFSWLTSFFCRRAQQAATATTTGAGDSVGSPMKKKPRKRATDGAQIADHLRPIARKNGNG